VTQVGLPLTTALRLASTSPAAFLGLSGALGRLAPGYRADLVAFDEDINVLATWVAGQGSDDLPR
jgi:N-acetylglucosamine-6-phosphate deacetylase